MIKKHLLVVTICGIAMLVAAAGIYAKAVPDVIELHDPAYEKHKKGVVNFAHKKHQTEYAKEFPESLQKWLW